MADPDDRPADLNTAEIAAEANRRARDAETRILDVAGQVDPRALLATLTTLHLTHPEDQAPDVDEASRWQVKLEYLAWALATRPLPSTVMLPIVDARVLEPLEAALEEYIGGTITALMFSDTASNLLMQSIQHTVRIDALLVRGEGSPELIKYLARGLYGQHHEWFANNLGFTIEQAFAFAHAIFALNADKLHLARKEARAVTSAFYDRFQTILARPKESWSRDESLFVDHALSQGVSNAANLAGGAHLFGNIGQTRGFTESELLDRLTAADRSACRAFLNFFSTEFGAITEPPTLLELNPLVRTPLLVAQDSYFLFVPPLLWDAVLNGPHYRLLADQAFAPVYNAARGEWLEKEVMAALARTWPTGQAAWSLEYGPKKNRQQLDGLVLHNRKLLLVECKSKTLTLSARQGNADALRKDIKQAIGDSFNQATRARDFIRDSATPVRFSRPDGSTIEIDGQQLDEVILISVFGRGALSVLAANIAEVGSATGMFSPGDYPWALSLVDLLGVSRTMEFEGQLLDYLRRRAAVVSSGRFAVHDEWDLLDLYFAGRLDVHDPEFAKYHRVSFTSGSDQLLERLVLDPTFEVPKELKRRLPESVRVLLRQLAASSRPDRLDVEAFILSWSDRQLNDLGKIWEDLERRVSADGRQHDASAEMRQIDGGFTIVCCPSVIATDDLERLTAFFVTRKYRARASKWLGLGVIEGCEGASILWFESTPWEKDEALDEVLRRRT